MAFNFTRPKFSTTSAPVYAKDMLRASVTWDPASIAAAAAATTTVSVPGAAVGDTVQIGFLAAPFSGLRFSAWVSAADTVTLQAQNPTAGALDATSATYDVIVWKK